MKRSALVALTAVLCIAATPAPRPSPSPGAPAPAATVPANNPFVQAGLGVWQIHMTKVKFNTHTGDFSTPNRVTITRPGGDITADRASGNQKRRTMTLYGNVVVHDNQGAFDFAPGASHNRAPSTLTCDQLQIDDTARMYIATGHVHYTQADSTSDSDKATLNDAAHTLTLEGNVHVVNGAQTLSADHVLYNTATGDAEATGKDVVMQMPAGPMRSLATPKPFVVKNPLSHKTPAPSPSP